MTGPAPPRSYTFVFPRPLKASERNYWRDTFVPSQRELYPRLETLDYADDLAYRLEDHPNLVNYLNDGVLGGYFRSAGGYAVDYPPAA